MKIQINSYISEAIQSSARELANPKNITRKQILENTDVFSLSNEYFLCLMHHYLNFGGKQSATMKAFVNSWYTAHDNDENVSECIQDGGNYNGTTHMQIIKKFHPLLSTKNIWCWKMLKIRHER
jgi:hypothetical protein